MFKLAAVLLMFAVASNAFANQSGSYSDHPELIKSPTVQALMEYAAETLSLIQKPFLKVPKIVRVQTQVVNGLNYKIDFIVENANGQTTTCQVVINVRPNSIKSMLQSQCQTS